MPHYWYHDAHLWSSYFLCRVEPLMTLVIVVEDKIAPDDPTVQAFVAEMRTALRHDGLCSRLCGPLGCT